jgi:hypothetical protein
MMTLTYDKRVLVKNDLLHVRFGNTGTQTVNTLSNIQARGLRTPEKGTTAHYCIMGQGIT